MRRVKDRVQKNGRRSLILTVLATIGAQLRTHLTDLVAMTGCSRGGFLGLLRDARNDSEVAVRGGRAVYLIRGDGILDETAILRRHLRVREGLDS